MCNLFQWYCEHVGLTFGQGRAAFRSSRPRSIGTVAAVSLAVCLTFVARSRDRSGACLSACDRFSRQRLSAFASSRERLRALCSSGRRVARGLDIRRPQPRPVWHVSISVQPFLSIAVIRFRQQPGTASHDCSSGERYFFQRSRARLHSLTPGFVLGGRGRLAPGPS